MPHSPAPRQRLKPPSYRRHSTGQAFVEIRGRRYYLGPHGSEASHAAYKQKLEELWLKPPSPAPELGLTPTQVDRLAIVDLLERYKVFAEQHYQKHGQPTGTFANLAPAMKRLRVLYGESLARHFGPLKFQALRQTWIDEGKARKTVNEYAAAVRRVFRWGVKNELIPAAVYEGLRAVEGIQPGRTKARDTQPVQPVEDDVIDATLPHLPPIVADMVRLQRLTGCRPIEICIMRRCDIQRGKKPSNKTKSVGEADVWEYRPKQHKTEHFGQELVKYLGPRAQLILQKYLFGEADGFCFSPADSERLRRAALHEQRQTPLAFGNRPGTNRSPHPRRKPGERYTTTSYRKAIHRACELAFPAPAELDEAAIAKWRKEHRWSPNQIRHTAATERRSLFGLEATAASMGHKHLNTTEIYALADREKAAAIAREVG